MTKMIGLGTVLKCSTAGTTTYGVTIGQVLNINGPSIQATDIEVTTLDSTSIFQQYKKGTVDPGTLDFTVIWGGTDTDHTALHALARNTVVAKWKLIFPTTTVIEEFDGYVSGVSRTVALTEATQATFTVKLSGDSATHLPYST